MATPGRTRPWVVWALAGYLLAVIIVLVAPVSYASIIEAIGEFIRNQLGIEFFGFGWIEFTANVLMFVPLGLLLTLLFTRPWVGMILALGISVLAELGQAFVPGRVTSLRDVVANGAGAALGVLLALLIRSRKRTAFAKNSSTNLR